MPPVRVKVYGLFPFTRRGYIIEAVVEWLLLVAVLSFWVIGYPHYREMIVAQETRPPLANFTLHACDAIPWILAVAVLLKIVEMYFVLRAFARKETAARSTSAPPPSP